MAEPALILIERADDPDRCPEVMATGQCRYKVVPGESRCSLHCSHKNVEAKKVYNYRLGQYRARVEEFADNPQAKSLREEIGVLRLLLESTLNTCNSNTDLLMATNKLSDLILRIEKLVSSCHRIEERTGQLLDKNVVVNMAMSIIEIISTNITDPVLIKKISDQIIQRLNDAQPPEAIP